jgi:hypothetical protein
MAGGAALAAGLGRGQRSEVRGQRSDGLLAASSALWLTSDF